MDPHRDVEDMFPQYFSHLGWADEKSSSREDVLVVASVEKASSNDEKHKLQAGAR
jgi:hypothetical protein